MKRIFTFLVLAVVFSNLSDLFAQGQWQRVSIPLATRAGQPLLPTHYLVYSTDEAALRSQLFSLSDVPGNGQVIELPMADGTVKNFKVWSNHLMPEDLAAKYPELRTFTAEAVDNPGITAKLDFTVYGFHAMIFNGAAVSFIDPSDEGSTRYYMVHAKKNEARKFDEIPKCLVPGNKTSSEEAIKHLARKAAGRTSNGYMLRTYRLALACDHQYAQAATGLPAPTIAQALSKMTTTMNRVNGVYERELAVTMTFIANEDTLIWPTVTGSINGPDPYTTIDAKADSCLTVNQIVCDARIGTAGYDIGHVFTTGAGGLSEVGVVCDPTLKAQSVAGQPNPVGDGFDIDYVSHEMGHEYGANHPFNNSIDNSCGNGNFYPSDAYEPGSGSTIMAYAGICYPDDLQPHSDPYFHAVNLMEIQDYITTGGDGCAVKTPTNNKLVNLPSFKASYTIPFLTPFELTAPNVTDSVADSPITYCWEEWNLGVADAGAEFKNTHADGPIFRSYIPVQSPTRIFPKNAMVLTGILSNAGTENAEGEKAPDVARYLTFRLTMRDIYQGTGCFLIPDDTMHLDVINTGSGFAVTSQNTDGISCSGNSTQQITWNVEGTNAAPINTANVDIFMSADGGNSWMYHIGNFLNNGHALVTIPNPDTTVAAARIKVKGSGNVFFNVNGKDFTVTHSSTTDTAILLYPVPAHSTLRVSSGNKGLLQGAIFNSIGQLVWKGEVNGELDISVNLWARGMYIIKLRDIKNQQTIRKFVVE